MLSSLTASHRLFFSTNWHSRIPGSRAAGLSTGESTKASFLPAARERAEGSEPCLLRDKSPNSGEKTPAVILNCIDFKSCLIVYGEDGGFCTGGVGLRSTSFNLHRFLANLVLSYVALRTGRFLFSVQNDLLAFWTLGDF